MPDYILRDIDPTLWRGVKVRAASEGRTARSVILDLLRTYAQTAQTANTHQLPEPPPLTESPASPPVVEWPKRRAW